MYFCIFVVISPWKRRGPPFEQTGVPITQGCFVPSSIEIGPVVLERRILKFRLYNYFSLFRNYLSLEKVVALQLNKFESQLSKDALCQVS